MVRRLALLALLIAGSASAQPADRIWAVQSATLAWTPSTGAVTGYRLERQVGAGAWTTAATVTSPTATVSLTRCAVQRFRAVALGTVSGQPAESPASDPSQYATWCGNPDLTGDRVVNSLDFAAFRDAYLLRRVGNEWVP